MSASLDKANLPSGFFIFTSIRYDAEISLTGDADSAYYLLPFHLKRLLDAASSFRLERVLELLGNEESASQVLKKAIDDNVSDASKPWRVRISFTPDGSMSASAAPLTRATSLLLSLPKAHGLGKVIREEGVDSLGHFLRQGHQHLHGTTWDVFVDTQPTPVSSYTRHKTAVRKMYNDARSRANLTSIEDPKEVLLWNEAGEVMEGSITTVYIWRRQRGDAYESLALDLEPTHADSGEGWFLATPPLISGSNNGATRRYALSKEFCIELVTKVEELVEGQEIWLSHASNGFFPGKIQFLNGSKKLDI